MKKKITWMHHSSERCVTGEGHWHRIDEKRVSGPYQWFLPSSFYHSVEIHGNHYDLTVCHCNLIGYYGAPWKARAHHREIFVRAIWELFHERLFHHDQIERLLGQWFPGFHDPRSALVWEIPRIDLFGWDFWPGSEIDRIFQEKRFCATCKLPRSPSEIELTNYRFRKNESIEYSHGLICIDCFQKEKEWQRRTHSDLETAKTQLRRCRKLLKDLRPDVSQ